MIGQMGSGCPVGLPLGLSLHHHLNPAGQKRDVTILPRDNVREILDLPLKMGDAFFKRRRFGCWVSSGHDPQ